MKWSNYFLPTGREVPAEAAAASHRLMVRAGLVRQLAAGMYIYLPLGLRALRKIEQIIRQEMNAASAVELLMPALQPVELWQESGRDRTMGATLFHLTDRPWRKGTVLGPTHEEVVTDIARSYIQSYKQLPLNLYQIQTKFRDEQRPKSGVLRTREFIMKDAYSFDADLAGLAKSYDRMYQAYCRIFTRCGLPYLAVEAESGPIGGDVSHEFMVPTDAGEDITVQCEGCGYAANLERAAVAPPAETPAAAGPAELKEVHTPGQRTIDQVCAFLKRTPRQMIKTLIYGATGNQSVPATDSQSLGVADSRSAGAADSQSVGATGSLSASAAVGGPRSSPLTPQRSLLSPQSRVVVALVRGDHEVNPAKLARAAKAGGVELADVDTIRRLTGADVGFAGPQGLAEKGVTIIVDHAVAVMHDAATGANRTDYHVTGLEPGRDFPLGNVADIRTAVDGDHCAKCEAKMHLTTCIEVGHVFKLGTKYSTAMGANFLDEQGRSHPLVMGCYGIGVTRVLAAVLEASHDDKGIVWPASVAPFQVLLLNLEGKDEAITRECGRIYEKLQGLGVEVLYDDRPMRPGPKFVDADLVGIPLRIAVGRRSFADGRAELKWRDSASVELLPLEAVAEVAAARIRARIADLNQPVAVTPTRPMRL
jgi:prolyl-tRNA synthetase